jgi:hypothetical protein
MASSSQISFTHLEQSIERALVDKWAVDKWALFWAMSISIINFFNAKAIQFN